MSAQPHARCETMTAPELVRVAVSQHLVDDRCTLVLRKDGVTVTGLASPSAPLTVAMPQFGHVKNVFASVSDGWELVEAYREMTQDQADMACEWSDYRKHYGASPDGNAYQAFVAGWQAARGLSHESVHEEIARMLASFAGDEWLFDPPIIDGVLREGNASPETYRRRAAVLRAAILGSDQ